MDIQLRNGKMIEVRAATVDDAEAILICMTQVIKETKNLAREPEEWRMTVEQEQEFLAKMADSPHDYMIIAFDQEQVIATAGFHGKPLQRLQHRVTLGISILQEYHHQGLGTYMMKHLIEKATEMGKRTIDLDVRQDNPHAIDLYQKMGFVQEGIKKEAFYVDDTYIDLVLMAKHL